MPWIGMLLQTLERRNKKLQCASRTLLLVLSNGRSRSVHEVQVCAAMQLGFQVYCMCIVVWFVNTFLATFIFVLFYVILFNIIIAIVKSA